jgi:hypothetical protein
MVKIATFAKTQNFIGNTITTQNILTMRNLFLLFLSIITLTASGQFHLLGFKGGASWTNVKASNFINNRNDRTGLAIGLTYDFNFKRHFTLGADIVYNQRGFTNEMIFSNNQGNPTGRKETNEPIRFNYDYVSMPLKVGFNYGNTVYVFTTIGLTPSIIVEAKTITPTIDFNRTIIFGETSNVTGRVNKFDIGGLIEIGGGYKFKSRYWVFTSFSYQHGFTTITNSNYFKNSKIRHYGMTLNLGLKYALTK